MDSSERPFEIGLKGVLDNAYQTLLPPAATGSSCRSLRWTSPTTGSPGREVRMAAWLSAGDSCKRTLPLLST